MQMDLICSHCSSEYQNSNPPRLLHCGHTFCHNCLQNLVSQQDKLTLICPEDQQSMQLSGSIDQLPKNIALIKLIETHKKNNSNNSSTSMKDGSFDVSKINREEECQEDDVAEELLSEIDRVTRRKQEEVQKNVSQHTEETSSHSKNSKVTTEQDPKQEPEMCLLHGRPIQVVCMHDYERLCSKCALFGEHKSHDFKSLQEIERENEKYYSEIIRMFQEKSNFLEKVSNKTVEKDLLQLLRVKTASLRKEITDKFRKLQDQLTKAEALSINQLEQTNKAIGERLETALALDSNLSLKYDNWEGKTLSAIQQKEKHTSEAHLNFYLKRNEIVDEGKQLLTKLQTNQEIAYTYTVEVIEDFTVEFHETGFNKTVSNLVEILEHKNEDNPKSNEHLKLKENQATLANCGFEKIEKVPQLTRQESEESLLEACQFQTHSFVGESVGSKILEQSFVSVRNEHHQQSHNSQSSTHQKERSKPITVKRKTFEVNKDRPKMKEPTHAPQMTQNIKKKLRSLKIPEKYEKVVEGIMNDTLQTVDLTNAQLGDNAVLQILELIKQDSKVKVLKLIRNKLTDDGIAKMLPYFNNILSLNLSQNQLTQNTIGILIDYKLKLPLLKTVILSQTKIVERKSKASIQRLKKMDVTVSV